MTSNTNRRRFPLWVAALALATAACESEPEPGIEPRLSVIEAEIFRVSCTFSACHGELAPQKGLSLAAGKSHAHLVNQPSALLPERLRVKPGDPQASFLFEIISKDQPSAGRRMPPEQPLSPRAIRAIEAWIAAGARND